MKTKEPGKPAVPVEPKKTGRGVLVMDYPGSQWGDYLRAFLEDISAELTEPGNGEEGGIIFDRLKPDICFVNPGFLSMAVLQKLKVRCQTDSSFHLFQIGDAKDARPPLPYICRFDPSEQGPAFLHKFSRHLKLPERIRILVADDDLEIRDLVTDYFMRSSKPAFDVISAEDGAEAVRKIQEERPDMALLDYHMPKKDGREVYAYIQSLERRIPVIVYLDLCSSQQVAGLYQFGRPVIMDKGGQCASMAHLAALIKKVFYFESRSS